MSILNDIKSRGLGEAVELLYTCTITHVGWEMDNEGWIVRMADGSVQAFTTNHGGLYGWDLKEAIEQRDLAEKSLTSINHALLNWKGAFK